VAYYLLLFIAQLKAFAMRKDNGDSNYFY